MGSILWGLRGACGWFFGVPETNVGSRDVASQPCFAVPRRTEAVWLRSRALSSRPKLTPASPIVAL